jgi:hypothetical protein
MAVCLSGTDQLSMRAVLSPSLLFHRDALSELSREFFKVGVLLYL